ncbi:MAG: hypothetical protein D3916_10630, partial [Candidatus Electrothrix sp. MAN1_4]|nr:hypothetical protein [Candidatus Electrothrix sp. MAN1_4]
MKNIKLFIGATLILTLVLFGTTIAVIPFLLSSDWVKNSIVSKVNKGSSGQLALGDCGIGWTTGFQCSDISYHDQNYQVDAARLTGTQGLFALMMAPKNLGTITVDDPVVVIIPSQKRSGSETAGNTVASQDDSGNSATTAASNPKATGSEKDTDQPATWFWHKMSGKILLNRAVVQVQQGKQKPQSVLHNGFLDATLNADTLNLHLSWATGNGQKGNEQNTGQANNQSQIKA